MSSSISSNPLAFPRAQQAEIIRANQRDIFHVSSLKEQTESVLRSWFGTRWLNRWEREVDAFVKLLYYGLTTGRATQTLGEEYTDIWQYTYQKGRVPPPLRQRLSLILLSVFPSYLLAKLGNNTSLNGRNPELGNWLRKIQGLLSIVTEINLAFFYLKGTYYDPTKRLLGIQHLSSFPENPHTRPPSYSLLGLMIGFRLLYRLVHALKGSSAAGTSSKSEAVSRGETGVYLDERPIESVIRLQNAEDEPVKSAEEDDGTALDVSSIRDDVRQSRNCTLCLEERTDSCVTECGHIFCWNCIVSWGREKAECPLCRQFLSVSKLLPIHNL